ncbi:CPBP family glutamic-type intramembrane protease [Legionella tunisiensis]|uniref:CPBP family glutamic-type intramembrane protease n=1 Tax=Legionella tunisiensis TaxID=1034944 RepID=UPI0002EA5879
MRRIRAALHLDGCILYGGVVEEILGRWGLMNVIAFLRSFCGAKSPVVMWSAIFLSGFVLAAGHMPAYLAAGCKAGRRFIYAMLLLNGWQAILFGWLFWQYGLLAAVVAHMIFHLGWYLYDKT